MAPGRETFYVYVVSCVDRTGCVAVCNEAVWACVESCGCTSIPKSLTRLGIGLCAAEPPDEGYYPHGLPTGLHSPAVLSIENCFTKRSYELTIFGL